MHEVGQLLLEGLGVVAAGLASLWAQRRADRRPGRRGADTDRSSLRGIALQLDVLDAMIEARCEPAVREQRDDEEHRHLLRRVLLDIDDLAGLPAPPGPGAHEVAMDLGLAAAALAGPLLVDPESSPTERARVFLSTGRFLDGGGGSFSVQILGNRGTQQITIASGTAQENIVRAIQQFTERTGVHALQDAVDPSLIRLTSRRRGRRQWVAAKRLFGHPVNAFLDENRANHADGQLDFGA